MKHYGIIGRPLGHSWSGEYFGEKFRKEGIEAEYCLYECAQITDVMPMLCRLDGCNITIPYKEAVIPLLDSLDPIAAEIGAVNVVKRCQTASLSEVRSQIKGYNTDWIGFMQSLRPLLNDNDNHNVNANRALIFGTGGVAKAVAYGLKRLGISYDCVTREVRSQTALLSEVRCFTYNELTKEIIEQHKILINCTPLGMWPKVEDCVPIPYEGITSAHLLYDCVYNPEETEFLRRGREQGARTKNGLEMLHIQADAAWRIWTLNEE